MAKKAKETKLWMRTRQKEETIRLLHGKPHLIEENAITVPVQNQKEGGQIVRYLQEKGIELESWYVLKK